MFTDDEMPCSFAVDLTLAVRLGYLVRSVQDVRVALHQHRCQSISDHLVALAAHEEVIDGALFLALWRERETT